MGRAALLGLCPNSLHEAEVWACALGLRSRLVHVLFSTPSVTPQPLAKVSLGKGRIVSWIGCGFHLASRGWFDVSFVTVKRLMIMMALFRFLCPFRLLLLISFETFLVSYLSTSSAGLEVSLISAQNYLWCFLSSYLPRGSFPCFPP